MKAPSEHTVVSSFHPNSQSQSVKILDGLLTLYKRPNSKAWWCGCYNKRVHLRASTKTAYLDEAKRIAQRWYFDTQVRISQGFAPTTSSRSFSHAADTALSQYGLDAEQGKRSKRYVRELGITFRTLCALMGKIETAKVNQAVWSTVKQALLQRKPLAERTLHQYKNAILVVLRQAELRGELKEMPRFARESTGATADTPRTWFDAADYKALKLALRRNVAKHKKEKTRWIEAAEELRDYVLFISNTGLRVGEARNVRFCDVEITKEKYEQFNKMAEVLQIRDIKGKRGAYGQCKSYFGCVNSFKNCIARHGLTLDNYRSSDALIFKAYHRDAFRELLKSIKLYKSNERPPRKRDLMSLRHTYICFRLLNGVPVWDVANNCRTSVQMIENHYAKHLSVLQSRSINKSKYELADKE